MGRRKTNEEFLKEVYEKNEYVRRGDIEILSEYLGVDTKIKCRCVIHDYIYWVAPSSLLKNIGCKKCGRERTTEKQMKSHEQFVAEVYAADPTTIVVGTYGGAFIPIDFMCSQMHIYSMRPVDFLHDERCPYCAHRKILIGFNNISTTHPDVAALLTNPDDKYKYMAKSKQKASFTCPLCRTAQNKYIYTVSERGFSCKYCSHGVSYPNKFGRAFLDQLPVDNYETEWQPAWAKPYFYDLYFQLDGHKYIVEWDGEFHYYQGVKFGKSFEERRERDRVKDELAHLNGVRVIRVDCRESKCDYIKNNILNSELSSLFDLSRIDWNVCDERANGNLVKDACRLYTKSGADYSYIARTLHIGESTARQYVKRGAALGWCEYDNEKLNRDRQIRHGYAMSVTVLSTNYTYYFPTMNACIKWLLEMCGAQPDYKTLRRHLDNNTPYKGYLFRLVNTTI